MDESPILSYLEPGETLLWSGAPQRRFRLGRQHAPYFFMLTAFAAFFLLPIIGLLNSKEPAAQVSAPSVSSTPTDSAGQSSPPQHKPTRSQRIGEALFFALLFGSFFGMILFVAFSQVGAGFYSATSTAYALTDLRVIVVTGKSKKRVTSLLISTLAQVQMQQWPDGLGTISLGPRPVWPSNSGLYMSIPSLENIPEPGKVFQIIAKRRTAA